MLFDIYEPCRIIKRGLDGYISSRKAFLIAVVVMGFLLYVGPSIFHWLRQKTPKMIDPNVGCIDTQMDALVKESYNFDAIFTQTYEDNTNNFLPYIGNGKIGVAIGESEMLFIFYKRSLSVPINYRPIVHVDLVGANSQEGTAVHYLSGIAYKFQCFNMKRIPLSVNHQIYAYRVIPSLLIQQIEITNPSTEDVVVSLKQNAVGIKEENIQLKFQTDESFPFKLHLGEVKVPESSDIIAFSIVTTKMPRSVVVKAKSSKTLVIRTVVHYSDPSPSSQLEALSRTLEARSREDIQKILRTSEPDVREMHIDVWKKLWHSGFSISFSRAQGALNGDKINATLYYVLSNSREFMAELDTTPKHLQSLQKYLYAPDKCYSGHHTLQASTLWSDLASVNDVNKVVSLWFLTLNKQGCHHLLQAGATGVMQAMILSFGGFKFSHHHLEFDCEPKDLHRDYHFRRILYGNATHVNISVKVQEDNKALIFGALDRSDKDYYACDGGCLDLPVKLGSEPVQFPVKLTNPLTAILYITSDRQHMEELKHTLHVKEVIEAPAHEHHIIALHRHGHQLGGLPAFFWVSIAFLIAVFHLFLIKLVYNEYCGSQDKVRKRYVV